MKLDEFQKLVKGKTKGKFLVKILKCLKYVDKHPEYADIVGISWCKTCDHFISNSKKLAAFLGIKSNSVNANIRGLGMKAMSCSRTEIANEFPEISNPRNWKKRYSQYIPLNRESIESDVNKVPYTKAKTGIPEESAKKVQSNFIELQELPIEWSVSSQEPVSSKEMDF
jgi:hypothetical protein